MPTPMVYTTQDLCTSPRLVFYEMTRACDLACLHCRACAMPHRHPSELTQSQSQKLLHQLARFPKPPIVVFTGGDPLKRPDLAQLIKLASDLKLIPALAPAATALATRDTLQALQQVGLTSVAISLDASQPADHDRFRGVPGSFDEALRLIRDARSLGLHVQVNTVVGLHNVHQLEAMANHLATMDIQTWSVFFLVPVGRGRQVARLSPLQYEHAFATLWRESKRHAYWLKTTEAPFYRRFLRQQPDITPHELRRMLGLNDGKGVMFISHTGSVWPSGFLPHDCGNVSEQDPVEIYQQHPVFQALRDPNNLKGKCGRCEYREICGGSRARALGVTGDMFESEPDCAYQPTGMMAMVN